MSVGANQGLYLEKEETLLVPDGESLESQSDDLPILTWRVDLIEHAR